MCVCLCVCMCMCVCVDIMIMITHFWLLTSHARDGGRSGTDALVGSRRSASEIPPLSLLSPGVEGPPDQVEGKRRGRLHWFIIVSSNTGESCFFLFKCSIRICAFCRYYPNSDSSISIWGALHSFSTRISWFWIN